MSENVDYVKKGSLYEFERFRLCPLQQIECYFFAFVRFLFCPDFYAALQWRFPSVQIVGTSLFIQFIS